MTREEYIESIVSQIDDKAAREEFRIEIADHLDDRIAFYTDAGYDYDYALDKAIGRMGDTATVGAQMNNLYDTTKVNRFIWVLTVLCAICGVVMIFGIRIREDLIVYDYSCYSFHVSLVAFATAYLLASKHKKHLALATISAINITAILLFALFSLGDIDYFICCFTSPLLTMAESYFEFTDNALLETITSYFHSGSSLLKVVCFIILGICGILHARQLRPKTSGKANTAKRYTFTKHICITAIVSELINIPIFLFAFIQTLRV